MYEESGKSSNINKLNKIWVANRYNGEYKLVFYEFNIIKALSSAGIALVLYAKNGDIHKMVFCCDVFVSMG
jgi:hypothetical protein